MRKAALLATPTFLLFWAANAAAADPVAAPATPEPAPPAEATPPVDSAATPTPVAEPQAAPAAAAPSEPEQSKMLLLPQNDRDTGPRTFHQHDGFYLRTNFGLGTLWGGFTTNAANNERLDASGSGLALDLLVGGSPNPGLTIGGGLIGNWSFNTEFKADGADATNHDVASGLIGVFIDGFPQPTAGWHLGGLVGLGGHTLSHDGVADQTAGFGGAIWGGYDQWVGDNFSVGGMLRFTAMRSTGEKDGRDVAANTASLGLMFTALYQ
jgi:hypothetical protein